MDTLPKELHLEIFKHLSHGDRIHVSQTCSSFARLVKPLLFDILSFSGSKGLDGFDYVWETHLYGRKKTTDLASLSSAVAEVFEYDIARYATTFKYSPEQYVEGFWNRYRNWVIEQIDAEIDGCHEIPDDMTNGWDDDEQYGYLGLRKVAEDRLSRTERERAMVEKCEQIWAEKIAAQITAEEPNLEALTNLFRAMPHLRRLEVGLWICDLEKYGFCVPEERGKTEKDNEDEGEDEEDDEMNNGGPFEEYDYAHYGDGRTDSLGEEVGEQFSRCETLWANFELVAAALLASNRHLKELELPAIDPELIRPPTHATKHVFSTLTSLTFNLKSLNFLDEDPEYASRSRPGFAELVRCCRSTLKKLDIRFTLSHYQLPFGGAHNFNKLLCEPRPADALDEEPDVPYVFSSLKEINFTSLIVHTPALTTFLSAQPVLETIDFQYVFLGNEDVTWATVASSLPPSCKSWYVENCGHRPFLKPDGSLNLFENWIGKFKPYTDDDILPLSTGWRVKDPFCDSDPDPKLWFNRQVGQFWLLAEGRKRQMTEQLKQSLQMAAFERVEATGEERVGEQGEWNRKRNMARVRAGVPDNQILPEDFYEKQGPPSFLTNIQRQMEHMNTLFPDAVPAFGGTWDPPSNATAAANDES